MSTEIREKRKSLKRCKEEKQKKYILFLQACQGIFILYVCRRIGAIRRNPVYLKVPLHTLRLFA
jgi:hypothetical protein